MGIPMLKIRLSWGRLIFNMGITILERRHHYIETRPPPPPPPPPPCYSLFNEVYFLAVCGFHSVQKCAIWLETGIWVLDDHWSMCCYHDYSRYWQVKHDDFTELQWGRRSQCHLNMRRFGIKTWLVIFSIPCRVRVLYWWVNARKT